MSCRLALSFNLSFEYDSREAVTHAFSSPFAPFNSGTWTFDNDPAAGNVTLSCDGVTTAIASSSIELTTESQYYTDTKQETRGPPVCLFPPASRWSLSCPSETAPSHSGWFAKLGVGVDSEAEESRLRAAKARTVAGGGRLTAGCNPRLSTSCYPDDVVFSFPRSQRELWANSHILSNKSPYFKTMFDSGFMEANLKRQAYIPVADLEIQADQACDSDTDSDGVRTNLAVQPARSPPPSTPMQSVVRPAAYTTYHSVLIWIYTGHIAFAPLRAVSDATAPGQPSSPPRRAWLEAAAKADPELPLPASPKSVYALADLLELPELKQLALDNFKSQLSVDNVVQQLASSIAVYDEVKDAIVAFAERCGVGALKGLSRPEVLVAFGDGGEAIARLQELLGRL